MRDTLEQRINYLERETDFYSLHPEFLDDVSELYKMLKELSELKKIKKGE